METLLNIPYYLQIIILLLFIFWVVVLFLLPIYVLNIRDDVRTIRKHLVQKTESDQ
jgi:uncharacterized membrane protein SpoIIM required for sporulation